MDPVIDEMTTDVLSYRKFAPSRHQLERWVLHLRDVVQPQLDELAALKTARAKTAKAVTQ